MVCTRLTHLVLYDCYVPIIFNFLVGVVNAELKALFSNKIISVLLSPVVVFTSRWSSAFTKFTSSRFDFLDSIKLTCSFDRVRIKSVVNKFYEALIVECVFRVVFLHATMFCPYKLCSYSFLSCFPLITLLQALPALAAIAFIIAHLF